jgi:uncharacterized membrane protein
MEDTIEANNTPLTVATTEDVQGHYLSIPQEAMVAGAAAGGAVGGFVMGGVVGGVVGAVAGGFGTYNLATAYNAGYAAGSGQNKK